MIKVKNEMLNSKKIISLSYATSQKNAKNYLFLFVLLLLFLFPFFQVLNLFKIILHQRKTSSATKYIAITITAKNYEKINNTNIFIFYI